MLTTRYKVIQKQSRYNMHDEVWNKLGLSVPMLYFIIRLFYRKKKYS